MLYTTLGRIVAGLAFALGLLGIIMGLSIATGAVVEPTPGEYLGSKTSGQWIDRGIYMVVFAFVVGVLTDISRTVAQLCANGTSVEEARGLLQAGAGSGAAQTKAGMGESITAKE